MIKKLVAVRSGGTVPYDNLTEMKSFLDQAAPGSYTAYDGNNGGHLNAVVNYIIDIIYEW